jgi:hypothetical protein
MDGAERWLAAGPLRPVNLVAAYCRCRRAINVINLSNEVARVLGDGRIFETFAPHLPHWPEVFRDPTQVSV